MCLKQARGGKTADTKAESQQPELRTDHCQTHRAQVRRKPGVINILLRAVWIAKALKSLPWPVSKGTDAAKCIQGRKRHILVDTMGLLLVVVVTAANVPEREGAKLILASLTGSCKKLRRIWVDGGYRGQEYSA
ncbi:MAG: transposase [Methylomicrobium sp.]|nr:transposase [Methylomicrobium sp.]